MSSLTVSPVLLRQLAFPSHALPLDSASLICGKEGGTKVTYGATGELRPSGTWETHFTQEWTQFTLLSCASERVYCTSAPRGGETRLRGEREALWRTHAGIAAISRMDLAELEPPPSFVSIPEGDSF